MYEPWLSSRTFAYRLGEIRHSLVLALNQTYVELDDTPLNLSEGDEIAVIPPLSGG
jgi:molybdopterin converting factor small subunit